MDTVKAPSKEGDLTNRTLNRTLYALLNRTVPYPYRINRIVAFMTEKNNLKTPPQATLAMTATRQRACKRDRRGARSGVLIRGRGN